MASEVVTSSGGLGRIKRVLLRKKIVRVVRVFFVDPANMSDVEESPSPRSTSSSSDEKESQEHLGEVVAAGGQIAPYIDDPLADSSEDEDGAGSSEDEDGLSPSTLEARYEREVPVSTWCSCDQCNVELLASAREYRCCREVLQAVGKLTFEGIEAKCVTEHPDFAALTNATVLQNVGPLLRGKTGRQYKYPSTGSQNAKNEFYRAVAYRWLARWIFGYLGWDNTRPLPACIYENIRRRWPTSRTTGYVPAESR